MCPKRCPLSFNPVCGSNGQTYPNECTLQVESCRSKTRVTVLKQGQCGRGICSTFQGSPFIRLFIYTTLILTISSFFSFKVHISNLCCISSCFGSFTVHLYRIPLLYLNIFVSFKVHNSNLCCTSNFFVCFKVQVSYLRNIKFLCIFQISSFKPLLYLNYLCNSIDSLIKLLLEYIVASSGYPCNSIWNILEFLL